MSRWPELLLATSAAQQDTDSGTATGQTSEDEPSGIGVDPEQTQRARFPVDDSVLLCLLREKAGGLPPRRRVIATQPLGVLGKFLESNNNLNNYKAGNASFSVSSVSSKQEWCFHLIHKRATVL